MVISGFFIKAFGLLHTLTSRRLLKIFRLFKNDRRTFHHVKIALSSQLLMLKVRNAYRMDMTVGSLNF